ncbi:monovalent cation:H+ antiporter, CPA1 family protein [Vibrio mimicus]|nr:monovalent cation:H+ antiporter, CPA1 family protein [Vibrio mimicus]
MMLSLLILIAGQNDWFHLTQIATETVTSINFENFLLKGILGFLLFAGGLGIKLPNLKDQKWEITVLALGATLFSTFFIGFALYGFCQIIGIQFDLVYCLLFGALISPTDPNCCACNCQKAESTETHFNSNRRGVSLQRWFWPRHLCDYFYYCIWSRNTNHW